MSRWTWRALGSRLAQVTLNGPGELVVAPGSREERLVFSPLVVPVVSPAASVDDLVLVLPLAGELVTHADEVAARRWRDDGGPALASVLCGGARSDRPDGQ